MVTKKINIVVDLCLKHKDYTTHNFMQWYVAEQIEEEALARTVLDKLKPNTICKWLHTQGVTDKEMLKTFNCGVGFCLIINPTYYKKINKYFSKQFKPYLIGKIIKGKDKVKLDGKINWV